MRKSLTFFMSIACLSVIFTFTSCDDDDGSPSQPTVDISFLSGDWKLISQKEDGNSVPVEPCDADDRLAFFATGNLRIVVGALKCDADETDMPGTWEFQQSNSSLTLTFTLNGVPIDVEAEILELTADVLRLKTEGENDDGDQVIFEHTYIHW